MNKTKWIIFAVLVVAVFGAVIWTSKNNDNKTSFTGDTNKIITDGPIADQVYGTRDQKVVLIEYADFQCPACSTVAPSIKQVAEQYKDKLTFIFRHFPLTSIHPNALAAAAVAEAAGQQGKFWEMNAKLYENQDNWNTAPADKRTDIFAGYASELGLNVDQFRKDLSSSTISDKIARDRETAKKYQVNSTPTFVLNGVKIDGQDAVTPSVIQQKIEEAIKAAYPDPAGGQNGQTAQ